MQPSSANTQPSLTHLHSLIIATRVHINDLSKSLPESLKENLHEWTLLDGTTFPNFEELNEATTVYLSLFVLLVVQSLGHKTVLDDLQLDQASQKPMLEYIKCMQAIKPYYDFLYAKSNENPFKLEAASAQRLHERIATLYDKLTQLADQLEHPNTMVDQIKSASLNGVAHGFTRGITNIMTNHHVKPIYAKTYYYMNMFLFDLLRHHYNSQEEDTLIQSCCNAIADTSLLITIDGIGACFNYLSENSAKYMKPVLQAASAVTNLGVFAYNCYQSSFAQVAGTVAIGKLTEKCVEQIGTRFLAR